MQHVVATIAHSSLWPDVASPSQPLLFFLSLLICLKKKKKRTVYTKLSPSAVSHHCPTTKGEGLLKVSAQPYQPGRILDALLPPMAMSTYAVFSKHSGN